MKVHVTIGLQPHSDIRTNREVRRNLIYVVDFMSLSVYVTSKESVTPYPKILAAHSLWVIS
jgi:isocitrate dehydrogenase